MPIPLYGFMQGDTLGLVILAERDDQLRELAKKLREAANLRVASKGELHVICRGEKMDPAMTVAQARLEPLDRFDVISREPV